MQLRKRDKAALWVVGILATWTTLFVNFAAWEGLYFLHDRLHIPIDLLNYELSVWPVLIDIVILMSTVIWTRQQMKSSDTQSSMLDAQSVHTEAIHLMLQQAAKTMQQAEKRDAQIEALIRAIKGRVDDIAIEVDELIHQEESGE